VAKEARHRRQEAVRRVVRHEVLPKAVGREEDSGVRSGFLDGGGCRGRRPARRSGEQNKQCCERAKKRD